MLKYFYILNNCMIYNIIYKIKNNIKYIHIYLYSQCISRSGKLFHNYNLFKIQNSLFVDLNSKKCISVVIDSSLISHDTYISPFKSFRRKDLYSFILLCYLTLIRIFIFLVFNQE